MPVSCGVDVLGCKIFFHFSSRWFALPVSSGQKKSVFDCMNNFVESVASAVDRSTADGDEDLCKVAVMSVLSPLYKVVSVRVLVDHQGLSLGCVVNK